MKRLFGAAAIAMILGCQTPLVNVEATPCECACSYKATTPQVGKGCYVKDDLLICPLVVRQLDVEPAYPSEDPRCTRQADGTTRCEVME